MKKTLKLTTYALFLLLAYIANAESNDFALVKQGIEQTNEDIVFTFMRKTQYIRSMSNFANKQGKALPYSNLYNKLSQKLNQLAFTEALSSPFLEFDNNDVQSMSELFKDNGPVKNAFKDYPAVSEWTKLTFVSIYDLKELFDGLFETDFSLHTMKSINIKQMMANFNLSTNEFKELIDMFYKDELEKYTTFIEKHKATLEKVSAFANKGFKVRTMTKKCKTLKNKQYCTSGNAERNIKSLSEIIPYLQSIKK